ncbi:MAG: zf-HC2 domain-containing protein [Lachnospiraceae bacterium]|nr:zf-HC2 domain-containing protein [Lachnospiraceae bacterium]
MEKMTCNIVRDLFPSYRDGLLSDSVRDSVKEHLEECGECREAYAACQKAEEEKKAKRQKEDASFGKLLLKWSVRIVFTVGIIAVTLMAGIIYLLFKFFYGGPPEITKGIQNYEKTIERSLTREHGALLTELLCFPETIPASAKEHPSTFYFFYQDTWDDPTCEAFLECTYSDEDYAAEVDRLEHLEKVYSYGTNKVKRDEERHFSYPAYIVTEVVDRSYEYALLTGENTVAYIYLTCMNPDRIRQVPQEYLPDDYRERMEHYIFNDRYKHYTMYQLR